MLFFIAILSFVCILGYLENAGIHIPYCRVIAFVVLWLAAGTSSDFSIDYPMYRDMYENPNHIGNLFIEPVWVWISDFLRNCGLASRAWFLFTSFLILSLFFYGIQKLSINFWVSLVFFVACFFYFESLNGIRQYMAMGIVFAALHWVIEKKMWKFILAVIVAGQFHMSAYMMLPMIFLMKIRYPSWLLWLALAVTFVAGTRIMDVLFSYVFSFFPDAKYAVYQNQDRQAASGLLKLFLNAIAALVLLLSDRIKKEQDYYYIYINMLIIGIVMYNTFYTIQVIMRLYWYFYPIIIILIPIIVKTFTPKSRLILISFILLLYSSFSLKLLYSANMDYGFDLRIYG